MCLCIYIFLCAIILYYFRSVCVLFSCINSIHFIFIPFIIISSLKAVHFFYCSGIGNAFFSLSISCWFEIRISNNSVYANIRKNNNWLKEKKNKHGVKSISSNTYLKGWEQAYSTQAKYWNQWIWSISFFQIR